MDLADAMGKAVQAARRGDAEALEVELSKLRDLPADSVAALRAQLRGLVKSVRSHPSYDPAPAAQAG